jgi:uncharacterized protein YbaP (TraB family)
MRLCSLLCLLLFINSLCAQAPNEKSLLWEISGNGLKQSSFLFGTIHILCPDEIRFSPVLKEKLEISQQLILEIDLGDPQLQTEMLKGAQMKNDTSLSDLLDEATFSQFAKDFQQLTGMPIALVSKMKPSMIQSLLILPMLGCHPSGWEQELVKFAQTKQIPMKGLETIHEQLAVLDATSYKDQANQLQKSLSNQDSLRDALFELLRIYKDQDISKMVDLIYKDSTDEAFTERILTDRNERWIPKIMAETAKKASFIGVGAGHLAGERGIISLLRKEGYTLRALLHQP